MTVIGTKISWTNSSWNLWIGCHPVSAGCDLCYAETLVNRSPSFKQRFDEVRLRLERLPHVSKFQPIRTETGYVPHLVFVNSMSDFWHDTVTDTVLHQVLDVMEDHPSVVFQILTKRPIRARKLLTDRYLGRGIPKHMWIGVTVEDNRVAKRLDIMRSIKQRTGGGTFFVSAEPIVGPTDKLDLTDQDWVISGGQSGAYDKVQVMRKEWLLPVVEQCLQRDIALWHKQSGTWMSHPNLDMVPSSITHGPRKMQWLREHGLELLPEEKGGATIDGKTYRMMPPVYHEMAAELSARLL